MEKDFYFIAQERDYITGHRAHSSAHTLGSGSSGSVILQ